MKIGNFLNDIDTRFKQHTFSGISFHSKNCFKNCIYFSVKGKVSNGNHFINEAIKNGANTIISDLNFQGYRGKILFIKNKNPRLLMSSFVNKIYRRKPHNLVAVTGTNGKSSVADFYYQILNLNNIKCASIGTLGVKSKYFKFRTNNTTLDSISLNKIFKNLINKGIENIILEASSHGLQQNRLDDLKFNTSIFTNFSRDHLDYHKSYKNYLNAKLILFRKLTKKGGFVISDKSINETTILKKISRKNKLKTIFLGKNADLEILNIDKFKDLQLIKFKFNNKFYTFTTKLIGKTQIINLLMAVLAASKLINISKIVTKLKYIVPINGRFENIGKIYNNSKVILDYSHTPKALETCISDIKNQFQFSKIAILFGCGGNRDKPKRLLMGKIADRLCNKIYLTDDNPRSENPKKIRSQIRKGIKKNKVFEFPSREIAIEKAIKDLKSGEVLIVAGKGHENYQEYKTKNFFSDKFFIEKYIKQKNKALSKNWKVNIINEGLNLNINKNTNIRDVSINSKKIKANDLFFGIKGRKFDGNKFAIEAVKKGCYAFVDKKYHKHKRIIRVKNSLSEFIKLSSKVRDVSNIYAIAITGSAGKTSTKNLIGQSFSQITRTIFSKNSFNNQYGVPISLFQIDRKTNIGIFEVGMDKKGEINKLSKVIKPDVGLITNISYAHIKNFKSLREIAEAKSELIENINPNGTMILNKDDKFYNFFKNKAIKKSLKTISFSLFKNKRADVSLEKIIRNKNNNILKIKYLNKNFNFSIKNELLPYQQNILATISALSLKYDLNKINKFIFNSYKIPEGRGNSFKLKIKNKYITVFDETYNSNPISLQFAINKFDKICQPGTKKVLILGDMLELGKFSIRLHKQFSYILNKSNIDKVYVYGKYIRHTFNKIKTQKKGKIFNNKKQIFDFINNEMANRDNLMIKASNSVGLNKIISKFKK